MSNTWLDEGLHHDLHVEHHRGGDAGAFTGGGWKLCWHITVSRWVAVDGMIGVLRAKGAEPHFVIGGRPGTRLPIVAQMVPLDQAGRSLAHPSGPETNRANCIQVEICATPGSVLSSVAVGDGTWTFPQHAGFEFFGLPDFDLGKAGMTADDDELCMTETHPSAAHFRSGVASWTGETYKALANLTRLVNIALPDAHEIPRKLARRFTNTNRFGGQGWVNAAGHLGHCHCPGNSHYDPTRDFKGSVLMAKLAHMPKHGYPL